MVKAKRILGKKTPSKKSAPRKRRRVLVKEDIQKIREEELGGGLFDSQSNDTRALFVSLPKPTEEEIKAEIERALNEIEFEDYGPIRKAVRPDLQKKQEQDKKTGFWKKIFSINNKFFSIFIGLIFAGLFCAGAYVFAVYGTDEYFPFNNTQNPSCLPSDAYCKVASPVPYTGANSAVDLGSYGLTAGTLNLNSPTSAKVLWINRTSPDRVSLPAALTIQDSQSWTGSSTLTKLFDAILYDTRTITSSTSNYLYGLNFVLSRSGSYSALINGVSPLLVSASDSGTYNRQASQTLNYYGTNIALNVSPTIDVGAANTLTMNYYGAYLNISQAPLITTGNLTANSYGNYMTGAGTTTGTSVGYDYYSNVTGYDTHYFLYNAGTGNNLLGADNVKTYFGTGLDASVYYNGTDLIVNPKEAGSGNLTVAGSLQTGLNGQDGELKIYSEQGGTDYSLVFQPNPAMTESSTYVWPSAKPLSNKLLQSDSSGNLTWADASGSNWTYDGVLHNLYSADAGNGTMAGADNFFAGNGAGLGNTYGRKNIAIGSGSLQTQSYANENTAWDTANVAIGYQALYSNQPTSSNNGKNNIAIGYQALYSNTIGFNNTAFGYASMTSNTEGSYNTAYGYNTFSANTTGAENTAIGYQSAQLNTTGGYNTATGSYSLYANVKGSDNVAFGRQSLQSNTYASKNVAVGSGALYTQGYENGATAWDTSNTAVGYHSLYTSNPTANNNGYLNTALGSFSGNSLTTGSSNVFLGYKAGYNQTSNSNLLIIDNQDRSSSALEETNSLVYGVFDAVPASQFLKVNGQFYITQLSTGGDTALKVDGTTGQVYKDASSLRYKTNVQPLITDFSKILQAEPKSFDYISNNKHDIGYIAEEFNELGLADLVAFDKEGRPDSIKYDRIPLYLNELIKQHQVDIDSLKLSAGLSFDQGKSNAVVDLLQKVLVDVGIIIKESAVSIRNLIVDTLSVKTARVEQLELVDKATGEVYCTWIENGEWKRSAGDCSQIGQLAVQADNPESIATEQVKQVVEQAKQAVQEAQTATSEAQEVMQQSQQIIQQATDHAVQEATQEAVQQAQQIVEEQLQEQEVQEEQPQVEVPQDQPVPEPSSPAEETQSEKVLPIGEAIQEAAAGLLDGALNFLEEFFSRGFKKISSLKIIEAAASGLSDGFEMIKIDFLKGL